MQQMNPLEAHAYAGYGGSSQYDESQGKAQKLQDDSDEQYADLLARKIKQELKDELRQRRDTTIGYRLTLAVVSVSVLVPLFIGLIIAVASGWNSFAIGFGFIAVCGAIFGVNAFFHWSTVEMSKQQK